MARPAASVRIVGRDERSRRRRRRRRGGRARRRRAIYARARFPADTSAAARTTARVGGRGEDRTVGGGRRRGRGRRRARAGANGRRRAGDGGRLRRRRSRRDGARRVVRRAASVRARSAPRRGSRVTFTGARRRPDSAGTPNLAGGDRARDGDRGGARATQPRLQRLSRRLAASWDAARSRSARTARGPTRRASADALTFAGRREPSSAVRQRKTPTTAAQMASAGGFFAVARGFTTASPRGSRSPREPRAASDPLVDRLQPSARAVARETRGVRAALGLTGHLRALTNTDLRRQHGAGTTPPPSGVRSGRRRETRRRWTRRRGARCDARTSPPRPRPVRPERGAQRSPCKAGALLAEGFEGWAAQHGGGCAP